MLFDARLARRRAHVVQKSCFALSYELSNSPGSVEINMDSYPKCVSVHRSIVAVTFGNVRTLDGPYLSAEFNDAATPFFAAFSATLSIVAGTEFTPHSWALEPDRFPPPE